MKILFLLKDGSEYGYSSGTSKSGLLNSAKFLLESLLTHKLISDGKIVLCVDGNSIDKAVHDFQPDLCIIEAIWVTPDKIGENIRLHPKTRFIVRVHSNIPFLAMEGVAIEWLRQYPDVAFNSLNTSEYIRNIISSPIYLPNIDEQNETEAIFINKGYLNIACFGSIRPLKNQLIQAVAAISYGDQYNISINYHINSSRIEQAGASVLKNIRNLFYNTRHLLIEHGWTDHEDFTNTIRQMDLGLQVSYTESFNIVSADFVHCGVPIIVSPDISWQYSGLKVDPNNEEAIVDKIYEVLKRRGRFISKQTTALSNYNKKAVKVWKNFLTP